MRRLGPPALAKILGAAALALAVGACGDMVLAPPWEVGLSFEPPNLHLDFREVETGTKQTLTLEIQSRGREPVRLFPEAPRCVEPACDGASPWSWTLPEEDLRVLDGKEVLVVKAPGTKIALHFAPGARQVGSFRGEAHLRSADGEDHVIVLEGKAVEDPLFCSPAVLDFGRVVRGEERTASIRCSNESSHPLAIQVPAPIPEYGSKFVVDRDGPSLELEVPPKSRLEITLRFLADGQPGPVRAVVPIRTAGTREPLFPGDGLELLGYVVPTQFVEFGDGGTAPALGFGFVPVGDHAEISLAVRNLYDRPVSLVSASLAHGEFEVVSFPKTLAPYPDAGGLVRLRFTPEAPGPVVDELRILAEREDVPGKRAEGAISVEAFGGGPDIECDPPWNYDFGQVGVGSMVRGTIDCRNVGPDLPTPDDDLVLLGVEVQGHLFRPKLIDAGSEGFRVEVDYRPVAEKLDIDELTIFSCGGRGCDELPAEQRRDGHFRIRRLQLAGTGVSLPPCQAILEPAILDFGQVPPGVTARLVARLVNPSSARCVVSRLDGLEVGGPFALAGPADPPWVRPWTLYPWQEMELSVEFVPGEVEDGEVRESRATAGFWVSNPARPRLEVELRGTAGKSCLEVDPPAVDFTAGDDRAVDPALACGAPDARIVVRNRCPGERRLTGILPADGSADAFLVSRPGPLPAYLAPGMEHELAVDFRPTEGGTFSGGIRLETDGETLLVPVEGRAAEDGRWFDRFPLEKPRLDLLLVLSSSMSMLGTPVATSLISGTSGLVDGLSAATLDWQLGITTTDLATPGSAYCAGGTGRNGGEAGRLVPATGGRPRILVPGSGFSAAFADNVEAVAPCAVAERGLDAAVLAVTPPLVSQSLDPRFPPDGLGNLGLSRSGAHLAVVFVSVADDAGSATADAVVAALREAKPPGLVSAWAIAGDAGTGCSFPGGSRAGPGTRYREVATAFGTAPRSVCVPGTWRSLWAELGKQAAASLTGYRLTAPVSTEPGSPELMAVFHLWPGGQRKLLDPWLWKYDWNTSTIRLQGEGTLRDLLAVGGELEVRYPLGCERDSTGP
jgi:hypothetical protein